MWTLCPKRTNLHQRMKAPAIEDVRIAMAFPIWLQARPERATETSSENAQAQGASARMSWARLLKRVFDHRINCTSPR